MENLEFVWDTPVPEKQSKRGRPIFFGKKWVDSVCSVGACL
jgi:hypothetical protein